jgi:hypothetical protein
MKGLLKDPLAMNAIPNKEEKIRNAVCFFASEHERLTGKPLAHTFLHRYLAFFDFASLERMGRPALGLLSSTIGSGPLPIDIYGKGDNPKDDCLVYVPQGEGRYIVKALGKPDLSCFSPFELDEMNKLVQLHAHHFATASDSSEAGYAAKGSSRRTWHDRRKAFTNDGNASDIDFFTKPKEVRMMSGLHLLTEKYVTQLKELETRMTEIKHKLEIVMEASRLLEEEGLVEDGAPGLSTEPRTF